jgi:hypothetical protein
MYYLPVDSDHRNNQEADVIHLTLSHLVFLDLPNGVLPTKVEKQWQ